MKEGSSYYAIIPANVRYDNRLSDSEKIMYGEITSLSNKHGICWAGNKYFSKLYEVSDRTISRRIKNLEKLGYIVVNYTYKENTKYIKSREIIINDKYDKVDRQCDKVDTLKYDKSVGGNNTSINNTSMNSIYSQVVSYLNDKADRNYKVVNGNTKHIQARVNEGYTLEDFKKVIDNKCLDWLGTEWERYLQPSTLFGNKFDTYLNTIPTERKSHNEFLDMLKRGEFDEY